MSAGGKVWVVFSDRLDYGLGEYDIVAYSEAEAKRHINGLKRMGFDEAFSKTAKSEDDVQAWHETKRGGGKAAWPRA